MAVSQMGAAFYRGLKNDQHYVEIYLTCPTLLVVDKEPKTIILVLIQGATSGEFGTKGGPLIIHEACNKIFRN